MGQPLILGRYRLLEVRGKGGFGTVEVVYDTRIQRRAAIKRIPLNGPLATVGDVDASGDPGYAAYDASYGPEGDVTSYAPACPESEGDALIADPDGMPEDEGGSPRGGGSGDAHSQFHVPGLAEARTAAMLANPNIVQVYDFETDEHNAYLIMEYVDGPTLAELAQQEDGCLSSDELAWVLGCVSSALSFAHENGVLHLDIKPENILIDHSGNVKVADFGIAQLAGVAGFGPAAGGTAGYMPPEQIGGGEVDERTDEWALASMLYGLMCGRNPFLAKDARSSLKHIQTAQVVPPSAYRNEFDPEVDRIIFTALCPDMDGRFESVTEFSDELADYLGDPETGKQQIVDMIAEDDEEEESQASDSGTTDIWADMAAGKAGPRICRILCGLLCTWISWLGMSIGGFPESVAYTCVGCVGFAGLLAPQLGSILALAALAAGIAFSGAYVTGGVLLGVALLWWVVEGRLGMLRSTLPLSVQAISACSMGPLYPLLCGFFLSPLRATVTSAFGGLLVIPLAAITGKATILSCGLTSNIANMLDVDAVCLSIITSPLTWLVLGGWVFTAFLMSLLCSRENKLFAIVGEVAGCLIVFGAIMLGDSLAGVDASSVSVLPPELSVGFSLIVMLLVTALGAPVRIEDRFEEE